MIALAIEGAIAVATLCRPPVNAINDEWIDRLDQVLDEVEAAQSVTVLWIRSGERLFSAGADLALMRSRFDSEEGRAKMTAFAQALQTVYARVEAMQQVSVAEIGGAAMGGGLELALACDLRVIGELARVGLPEARLGLLPGAGGTQRLTRICGDAISRRLILGAEIVGATEAVALGLAHWAAPAEGLQATARAVVERIAELPQAAVAACKHCIASALDATQDGFEAEIEGTAMLLASAETRERVHRFLNKG